MRKCSLLCFLVHLFVPLLLSNFHRDKNTFLSLCWPLFQLICLPSHIYFQFFFLLYISSLINTISVFSLSFIHLTFSDAMMSVLEQSQRWGEGSIVPGAVCRTPANNRKNCGKNARRKKWRRKWSWRWRGALAWNVLTPQNSNNFFCQHISMNYLYQSQVSKPLSINKKNSFK